MRFEEVVAFLAREFPHLAVQVKRGQAPFEASAEIPVQRGLVIPVHLNLQNADKLHLDVGDHFAWRAAATDSSSWPARLRRAGDRCSGSSATPNCSTIPLSDRSTHAEYNKLI